MEADSIYPLPIWPNRLLPGNYRYRYRYRCRYRDRDRYRERDRDQYRDRDRDRVRYTVPHSTLIKSLRRPPLRVADAVGRPDDYMSHY